MDRVIDEPFRFEGRDGVDHDVVGSPTGPLRGKAQARNFYEKIFADLEQQSVSSTRRYYGEDFVVDESLWRGTAVGNPLGFAGRNRPLAFRILHLFEFDDAGAIRRKIVWMGTGAIAAQLSDAAPEQPGARATVMSLYEAFDRGELKHFAAVDSSFEAKVFGATVLDRPGLVQFDAKAASWSTAASATSTPCGRSRAWHRRLPAEGRAAPQYRMRTDAALRSAAPWYTASMLLPSGSSTKAA